MFKDRKQAGATLARELFFLGGLKDVVVLAVPRGGVPVAKEVSRKLDLSLGVLVTKKIGAPGQEELALGAVGPEGSIVLDDELIQRIGIGEEILKNQIKNARLKLQEYASKFKSNNLDLRNKIVVLIDDGIATGATVEVALRYIRKKNPKEVILAVPVAAEDSIKKLSNLADKVVVLEVPGNFRAVGQFYKNFPQVTDDKVIQLLDVGSSKKSSD